MITSLFRPAIESLAAYAGYHRDQRNIATHLLGIPLVVLSLAVWLGRTEWSGWTLSWGLWALSALWYLSRRGAFVVGLGVVVMTALLVALATPLASGSLGLWLASGSTLWLAGWTLQALGHYYEGRRPAFSGDPRALLVGPQFVVAEWLFSLGCCLTLRDQIERRVGPKHLRDLAMSA